MYMIEKAPQGHLRGSKEHPLHGGGSSTRTLWKKGRLSGFLKAPQGQLRGSKEHPLRVGDWGHLHYGKGATQWFSNDTPEETQGLQGASVACGGGGNLHYGKGTIKFYISYSI